MSHTRGTFAALVDALIPETPELEARGEVHVPGGLQAGLVDAVVARVNNFLETRGLASQVTDAVPLAPAVATLLDVAAVELLVRRRAEDALDSPDEAFSRGAFSRLSREDRLRALRLLEEEGLIARLADRFDAASLGAVQFLAGAMPILVEFVYYSEICADEGEERAAADGRHEERRSAEQTARSLGWRQADYPGPSDGYPVLLGYEVEEFEENDY